MKRSIFLMVLTGLLLAGCAPVTAPSPAPAATAAVVATQPTPTDVVAVSLAPTTVPTVAAPKPAEVPANKANAQFGGISFTVSATLAKGAEGKTLPAQAGGADAPWWVPVPQHSEIDLTGYTLQGTNHDAAVMVYPVAEFTAANPEAAGRIAALAKLLADKPASPAGQLPFLPLYNAQQATNVKVAYLSFQGGHGVRFLTQYAQGLMPINNQELFYTFQGLTDDGKFYVSAILPVSHDSLPGSAASMPQADRDAMLGNYNQYRQDITAALAAQPDGSFKPGLPELDSLIQSLHVAASAS